MHKIDTALALSSMIDGVLVDDCGGDEAPAWHTLNFGRQRETAMRNSEYDERMVFCSQAMFYPPLRRIWRFLLSRREPVLSDGSGHDGRQKG
jgi:hypothetical protein